MAPILLKAVYTALLLGLTGMLLRELWRVWFDPQVYIGRFEVVTETGPDDEASAAFAKRIMSAQAIVGRQLVEYQTRSGIDSPTDATYRLPGTEPLPLPPAALAGVDITIQNVNVTQLLGSLRRSFLAPNEVTGHVTARDGSVLASVSWPRAPALADGRRPLTHFLTPSRASIQDAASEVACSVSWARAASADKGVAAFSREQFCAFAQALGDLYSLAGKASRPEGLGDDDTALLRARAAALRAHYSADAVFPEIYRLRADLLDLLPEQGRTQAELIETQEDRLRYAMLSPGLRDLTETDKRLTALALARPAIVLEPGKPPQAPENWAALTGRNEAQIRAAAASTGLIVKGDGTPVGTGFIMAPGFVMTAQFVLDEALRGSSGSALAPPRLCLGLDRTECDPAFNLGDVVYKDEGTRIAIARIANHDPVLYPPLPLASPLPKANTMVGRYAFVVGYPFRDRRMPEQFVRVLLDDLEGRKRFMPGRILAFGSSRSTPANGASAAAGIFTTDISTAGGTAGGPLVDLATGTVLGMSYAGVWQGERGKFAYAEAIPEAVLDLIGPRTRGQQTETSAPPPGARTEE